MANATSGLLAHGGNLDAARAAFGDPGPDGWLDMSTGINPDAYPLPPIPPTAWTALPQADSESALLNAARAYFAVPASSGLVAAPGTQALIQLLPRLKPDARVAIVQPTYSEHAIAWRAGGAAVVDVSDLDDLDDLAFADCNVAVVVNPNNPDGRDWPRDRLLKLAAELRDRDGLLVVDEAFRDVASDAQMTGCEFGFDGCPSNVIVLRSFGKFFGLAGARLGFAVGAPHLTGPLADALGPWAVPGPALVIGGAAYGDGCWQADARALIRDRAAALVAALQANGFRLVGNAGLFVTAEHACAEAIYAGLGRRGILVRAFPYDKTWLRFGLTNEAGFQRLQAALPVAVADAFERLGAPAVPKVGSR